MICIEINDSSIKIIVYKKNFKPYIYRIIELKQSIVNNGYIVEKNELTQILKDFITENNIKSKRVSLIIQSNSIITRNILLPKLKPNELKSSIMFQIKEVFPVDISKYEFDYKINGMNEQNYEILIAAVSISLIEEYINLFKNLNLEIVNIDTKFNSTSKLFINKIFEKETLALIDIDKCISDFTILTQNKILFTKTILLGLNEIDMLINEVNKFIDFYNSRGNIPISKIHIVNQGAYEKDIIKSIQSALNINVEPLNIKQTQIENILCFLSLIGLTQKYNYKDFNLITNKSKTKHLFVFKCIFIIFILFTITISPHIAISFKQKILYDLTSKINEPLFNQLTKTKEILESTTYKLQNYKYIISKLNSNYFYNHLELISNHISKSNYIKSININNTDNHITINGNIETMDLLFEFIENLKFIKIFKSINFSFNSDESNKIYYIIEIDTNIEVGDNYD